MNNQEQNTYGHLRREHDARISTANAGSPSMTFLSKEVLMACQIQSVSTVTGYPVYVISPLVKDNQPSFFTVSGVRGVDDSVTLTAGDYGLYFIDSENRRYIIGQGVSGETSTMPAHIHLNYVTGS